MSVALEAHNLTVSYDSKPVLWNVDFEIPQGKMVGVLGPNGSGKTTLLKCAMQLIKPDAGFVKILNEPMSFIRSKVAYVPQRQSVDWDFPASVEEVVQMGLYQPKRLYQRLSKEDRLCVNDALEALHIQDLAKRQIGKLSGGQQQRVFLARALVRQAEIYLLDEPFAGIDAQTESIILDLLKEKVSQGKSVVCVHHDLKSAADYFDWGLFMNKHVVANGSMHSVFTDAVMDATYNRPYDVIEAISEQMSHEGFSIKRYKERG